MKWIGFALVVIALCAASFAGDLGWIDQHDARRWDLLATVALILFGTGAIGSD